MLSSSHSLSVIADHSSAVKLMFTVHYGIFRVRDCTGDGGLSWDCTGDGGLSWDCTGDGGLSWDCTGDG